MKTHFLLTGFLALSTVVASTQSPPVSLSTTPSVVERGLNHQVWQRLKYVTNPVTGNVATRTNQYVQLSSGLHYRGDNGELLETKELIQPAPGGAVAHEGPHKVAFALNANMDRETLFKGISPSGSLPMLLVEPIIPIHR